MHLNMFCQWKSLFGSTLLHSGNLVTGACEAIVSPPYCILRAPKHPNRAHSSEGPKPSTTHEY
jgi:hypothetical protein